MSALGDIFLELDRRLTGIDGIAEFERMPSGDPSSVPALRLFDDGDEPIDGEPGGVIMREIVSVEGFVEGSSGAVAHDAMLDLHAAVVFALCDDGDLGGLVQTIEVVDQRRVEVRELSSVRSLAFAQNFAITYATVRGNPAARA